MCRLREFLFGFSLLCGRGRSEGGGPPGGQLGAGGQRAEGANVHQRAGATVAARAVAKANGWCRAKERRGARWQHERQRVFCSQHTTSTSGVKEPSPSPGSWRWPPGRLAGLRRGCDWRPRLLLAFLVFDPMLQMERASLFLSYRPAPFPMQPALNCPFNFRQTLSKPFPSSHSLARSTKPVIPAHRFLTKMPQSPASRLYFQLCRLVRTSL